MNIFAALKKPCSVAQCLCLSLAVNIAMVALCFGLGLYLLSHWGSGQAYGPFELTSRLRRGMTPETVEQLVGAPIVLKRLDSPQMFDGDLCDTCAQVSDYGVGQNVMAQHNTSLFFHDGRLRGWASKVVYGWDEFRISGVFRQ